MQLDTLMVALFVIGLVLLAVGAWMAWPPAGPLVAGGVLVLLPIFWARGGWRASSSG